MRAGFFGTVLALAVAAGPAWGGLPEDLCAGVAATDGICSVFVKPDGRGMWGDLYGRFFEPLGFRRSVALVVGVSSYTGYSNLEAPVNDATRIRDLLIQEEGFDVVITLTDRAASKDRIERLMDFHIPSLLESDDRFVFYFSGHGDTRDLYGDRQRGYLVLSDAPEKDWSEMIGMDRVEDWWENINHARQSLWALDACFSGLAGTQRKNPLDDKTRRRLAQRAHHLITAGTGGEQSVAVGGASLFTTALIEATRGAADLPIAGTDPDGVVSLKEIDLYIGKTLDREIARLNSRRIVDPYKMSPQMSELGAADGEFFFISRVHKGRISGMRSDYDLLYGIPEAKGGAAALPSACNADLDRAIWDAIRNETDPDFFEAYLKRVDSGELCGLFADIARLKVRPSASPTPVEPAAGTDTALAMLDAPGAEAALNLRPEDRRVVQQALTALDFDTRGLDGVFGANTRRAIINWQRARGEKPTGYLTAPQYGSLLAEAEPKLAGLESAQQRSQQPSLAEPAVGIFQYQPGDEFRDCEDCPLLVVVPAGSFTMGSTEAERQWAVDQGAKQKVVDWETPQHPVEFQQPFAIGKYEVTRAQFGAFVEATGHEMSGGCWGFIGTEWKENASNSWRAPGFEQTEKDPVVCVSWQDVKAYVKWLNEKTGHRYRLPSEAEWEYAARANTTAMRPWGDDRENQDGCAYANGADLTAKEKFSYWRTMNCWDGQVYTAPVGSYSANALMMHDMIGNVREWVEDCWNESYSGAPKDGSASASGDCSRRLQRGGSWGDFSANLRSAFRLGDGAGFRYDVVGFRVARRFFTP